MRIRRQVINKTSDVKVKQVTLQDKIQEKIEKKQKSILSVHKRANLVTTPSAILNKPKKDRMLFMDD